MLETQPQIVEAYVKSGRVKMVFRHLLDFGDPSLLASQAAECAGDQGKFWQMHGLIYQRQNFVFNGNAALYQKWSKEDLKIDDAVFGACMSANKHKAKI